MGLSLIPGSDPMLRQTSEAFDFNDPNGRPTEFAKALAAAMVEFNGVGLSAVQVGFPLRVFAIRTEPLKLVCFNPRMIDIEGEQKQDEGCLSFPGLFIKKIKRARSVNMRFTMADGETVTQAFEGLIGQIIQHEFDHLNGVLFMDKADRYHREQGYRKHQQYLKGVRRHARMFKTGDDVGTSKDTE